MMSALKKASRTKSLSLSQDDFIFPRAPRSKKPLVPPKSEDTQKIFKYIDENVIGKGVLFLGPFGRRKVVYADYSSSGRSLQFLEDYINKEVLPAFGDCDCTSAVTGLQSLLYNNESRDLIKSAVNATSDQDEIIFCNNPSDRLAHLFTKTKDSIVAYETSSNSSHNSDNLGKSNVVLFVSNFEPENNIRSWIDGGAIIERIDKNREGFLDLVALEKKLSKYSESNYKLIGLFSGVSRLTGILSDDVATTILLHQYNAISLWDCSDIASSAQMHVNSALPGASKDGLFFNCNKMIGGLQSSSVLIIKKSLIANFKSILNEMVDTVSIVRCGLVMQLKEALGTHIMTRQEKICKQMLAHIRTIPEIVLLAPTSTTAKRIPTMCFLVKHPRGAFLHHRFVVAVLNDIFGIQSSANSLLEETTLGISSDLIKEYEKMLNHEKLHTENLRPGYIRITFPFFMNDAEVGYILEALKMVATEAWKLLPQYEVDEKTGEWRHHSNSLAKERKWLQSIRYNDGRMLFNDRRISAPGGFPTNFADCLQTARNIFNRARKMAQKSTVGENLYLKLDDETEKLRWYMLPGEAHELLLGHSQNVKQAVPIDPNKMFESPSLVDLLTCRTNSLSALDIRRYQKSQSLPATPQTTKLSISPPKCSSPMSIKHQLDTASPPSPIVRFTLGGEVSCATNFGQSPQVSSLISSESIRSRNRCHSWGPNPSPVWPRILGNKQSTRSCSVSSQTDLHLNAECTPEFRVGSSSSDNEDINNYVKGVTKEITDEIKSEIREVISQVEDVLENSESVDLQSVMANITSAEDLKTHDSVSAGDIVEFLKEFSKDLTSEVKSEIREASNAVDEFISPDCTNSRQQENDKRNTKLLAKQRFSDISHETSPKPHDDKHRSESLPSPEHSVRPFHYTGAISKIKSIEPRDASSQDSGINLSFQDDERKKLRNSLERNKFTFDENDDQIPILLQQSYDNHNDSSSATSSPKILKRQSHLIKRSSSELDSDEQPTSVWHNLPKDVWKTAAETIDEFDMLRDGDKVLICISGSSSSICLLHLLRQFTRVRGLHVEFGAVTIGESVGLDPRALMLYLRDLGIDFIFEASDPAVSLKTRLSTIARRKGFNVVALGNTLDKLADDVLKLMLYKGKLYSNSPCTRNCEGDLKVIKPLIFIRERILEDFSIQKNLPSRPSRIFSRMPDGIHSILKVQEVMNPNVYDNIKNAVYPLLLKNFNYNFNK